MTIVFIFLKILLILLCIMLSILLLIVFIPFEYFFIGKINGAIEGKIEIRWLFRLIKVVICTGKENPQLTINICRLNIYDKKLIKKTYIKKQSKSIKENRLKKGFKFNRIGKESLIELFKYSKEIFNIIRPKHFKIAGVYGFYDPSLTGMFLGLISMLSGAIPNAQINMEPSFDEEFINIEAQIHGNIKVYVLCYRTIKLLMKKEIRQILFKKSKTTETF